MMTIGADHMALFTLDRLRQFEDRVLQHLRSDLAGPSSGLADDELRLLIRSGVERGKDFGLIAEREVVEFIDASVLLGDQFDSAPENEWARRILNDEALSPVEKGRWILLVACDRHATRSGRGG